MSEKIEPALSSRLCLKHGVRFRGTPVCPLCAVDREQKPPAILPTKKPPSHPEDGPLGQCEALNKFPSSTRVGQRCRLRATVGTPTGKFCHKHAK